METMTKAMYDKGVSNLILKIPEDIVDALRLPPGEVEGTLQKELALTLYQRGVLSSGKASVLAGMGRWEFEELLGQRHIQRHYTEKSLEEDIVYVRSHDTTLTMGCMMAALAQRLSVSRSQIEESITDIVDRSKAIPKAFLKENVGEIWGVGLHPSRGTIGGIT